MTKKNILMGIVAILVGIVFTGCGLAKPKVPENAPIVTGIVKEDLKVYIDNSADIDKQKRAVAGYIEAFNKTKEFKVVNTSGLQEQFSWEYVGAKKQTINSIPYYIVKEPKQAKFYAFRKIQTYFFDFENTDIAGNFIAISSSTLHNAKPYNAKPYGEHAFEITGFDSKKEAFDIYLQLLRETIRVDGDKNENTFHAYLKEIGESGYLGWDWKPTAFYAAQPLRIDPELLDNDNRLIIYPTILDASLKESLSNVLKYESINVVQKPKEANFIIKTTNILFEASRDIRKKEGAKETLKKNHKKIKEILGTSLEKKAIDHVYSGKNFADLGHKNLGGAMMALGTIGLLNSTRNNITTMHYVSMFDKEKSIFSGYVNPPNKITIKPKIAYQAGLVYFLNYKTSKNLVSRLTKH